MKPRVFKRNGLWYVGWAGYMPLACDNWARAIRLALAIYA